MISPRLFLVAVALVLSSVAAWARPVVVVRLLVEPGSGESWAAGAVREDAATWLARQMPSWEVRVGPRESASLPPIRSDADALRTLAGVRVEPGAARTIDVIYSAAFADKVRGRTWTSADGRALIVLHAASLAANAAASGARLREIRVLRHELIHAVGWEPAADHRLERGGRHCADYRCLMHQGPTLADLVAAIAAPLTRLQAHELCARCRDEVARVR